MSVQDFLPCWSLMKVLLVGCESAPRFWGSHWQSAPVTNGSGAGQAIDLLWDFGQAAHPSLPHLSHYLSVKYLESLS